MMMNRFARRARSRALIATLPLAAALLAAQPAAAFNVTDDLFVNNSACIGFDCVLGGETFGADTVRLKENNTRLHFEDTSNTAGFPANDWRLVANDQESGGGEHFSIFDATANRNLFTVEAGARANALYVDSTSRLGLGTPTPVLDFHMNTANTPGIRFQQNNSQGWGDQTWDVAGNEANFFIRDVNGGSQLPFRIRPGADTSSIDIASSGDVGMGFAGTPQAALHVRRTGNTNELLMLENANTGAVQDRALLKLVNKGGSRFQFDNTDTGNSWRFQAGTGLGDDFEITKVGTGQIEFDLHNNGDLDITGALSQGSDRASKEDIEPVSGKGVLRALSDLPVSEWTYKADEAGARHLGPMAQDFRAAFGLGDSSKLIAPADMAGVALAAIKQLAKDAADRDASVAALQAENRSLSERVESLEAQMAALGG